MPILLKRDSIPREVCWECGLGFSDIEPVLFWDALKPILLHSKCALDVGRRLLSDANQAIELDAIV